MKIIDLSIQDNFWSRYQEIVKKAVIPYQWKALNDEIKDAEPSHAIKNFKIAANLETGEYYGEVFQDSDVAKWIETVAYSLKNFPDDNLEQKVDELIDIIELAQDEDGYLNTYYMLKEPDKKWTNLRDHHELYCAGHFIEAAVAYYNVTKKRKLLNIVCKYIDLIDELFGLEEGKRRGYPGHQEIELALLRLYEITKDEKHLNLAKYFLYQRGTEPNYFEIEKAKRDETDVLIWNDEDNLNFGLEKEYQQDHVPIMKQKEAVGHAVRAVYMYTAMADLAVKENNQELYEVTKKLWNDVVNKKMYITGGIGSSANGESFSDAYDLPNDSMYCETCASVGMTFWANKMNKFEKNSDYHNILEREIYNGTISGMNLAGNKFLYVNPLEVNSKQQNRVDQEHVLPERQPWFKTACCPPNLARMITSIEKNLYDIEDDAIYINQYIGNQSIIEYQSNVININLESKFPWNGEVKISLDSNKQQDFKLFLRIPDWCCDFKVTVNGRESNEATHDDNGYLMIDKKWSKDEIKIEFSMPVLEVKSNPRVRNNIGKVALQRGPIVYCLEEIDNGENLAAIYLEGDNYKVKSGESDLNNMVTIETIGEKIDWKGVDKNYSYSEEIYKNQKLKVKAVPYFSWNNRGSGEMIVWINKNNNE